MCAVLQWLEGGVHVALKGLEGAAQLLDGEGGSCWRPSSDQSYAQERPAALRLHVCRGGMCRSVLRP